MSKYQAYSEYKDSGVEWVGSIPSSWEMWKLSHAYELIGSGTTPTSNNEKWFQGDIPWITTGELRENIITDTTKKVSPLTIETFTALKIYPKGSIAIAMYGATIGRLGILGVDATTNQACCVMTKSKVLKNKYLFYWLQAFKDDIVQLSSGGGQPNINQEKVAALKISAPVLKEQTQIAAFLDHETAKIDTLIEKQQQLIELLKEKRQAVISHAVTKGLNPQAPMKDSGVEWLGEVPEHWVQLKLKHVVKNIIDAEHKTAPYFDNGNYLVCRTTNVRNGKLLLDGGKYTNKDTFAQWTQRAIPEKGDILFTREAPAGEACIYDASIPLCLGQRMVLFKLNKDKMLPEFVLHSLYSGLADDFVKQLSQGSTVSHFNMADIQNIPLFEPPFKEQLFIVEYLKKIINKYDTMSDKAASAILLMQERRTALISAAVTGKIDVRNWAEPTTSSDTNEVQQEATA
ncbi:restriction endonuclease subunit S [Photobacterium damselae subsp. damselae]|uniref:restriction endonuclease subunit S n=1 Tax=Photobacterium damselae TaxID=38293 RepID=UPI001EEF6178|nr:restriction endonuclease subunit S [Photobacterium damselae]UKA24895.1 restriction endonuclease subunit S [Photobacterium damselae subsp. damselae]